MADMVNKQILPAVMKYTNRLVRAALDKRAFAVTVCRLEPEQPLAGKPLRGRPAAFTARRASSNRSFYAGSGAGGYQKRRPIIIKISSCRPCRKLRERPTSLKRYARRDCGRIRSYSELMYPVD